MQDTPFKFVEKLNLVGSAAHYNFQSLFPPNVSEEWLFVLRNIAVS
jgi:hypothetical protein